MENGDIFEIAKKFGYSLGFHIGSEAILELELSLISRLIPGFKDNPVIRARQHVLFYWDASYLKSTFLKEFAKTLPDTYSNRNITSLTPETIYGSITDTGSDVVKPVLADSMFIRIDELVGFVGTGNKMRDMTNVLNTVMEGGKITRHLVKLSRPDFGKSKVEKLKEHGIEFNPEAGFIRYQPDVCLWAASRPMSNKIYTQLRSSGFLNRFHILQRQITDFEAERFFTEDIRLDQKAKKELTSINNRLYYTKFEPIPTPSQVLMEKIVSRLKEIVTDEIRVNKRRLAELTDVRTRGDVTREIASFALIRTIEENEFKEPFSVVYNEDDLEFILSRLDHFVEFKINPIFAADFSMKLRKKRPRDRVKELILEILSNDQAKQKKDINNNINSKITVGGATIANALKDFLQEKRICQPKYAFYKLKQPCSKCSYQEECTDESKDDGMKNE